MKLLLALISFLLLLNGCVTYQKCVEKFGQTKTDTLYKTQVDTLEIKWHVKDTVTRVVPGERVVVKDSIPCPDLINKKFAGKSTNGTVEATVEIRNNKITVDCKADSLKEIIITKEREITILKQKLTTIQQQTQFVDKRTWYQKLPWYAWLAIILSLLVAVLLAIKKLLR